MKYAIFLTALLVLSACASAPTSPAPTGAPVLTMYKSPSCGCCMGHAAALEQAGYDVEVVPTRTLQDYKKEHGIPTDKQSCHTIVTKDYFIEGHVPIDIVNKLLEEKPDIDGIMLPDMPSGTPGMPGPKMGEWVVYAIKGGEVSEYARV